MKKVEQFLSSIPRNVLSEAAIQSHSYARALLHFEEYVRIEAKNRDIVQMQPLYNMLQKIYARVDDADSLECLASKLISPTLQQQIIQHEVCGRWPEAQSCYEVLLQQEPDHSEYQLGLLRCLENMGHYGIID